MSQQIARGLNMEIKIYVVKTELLKKPLNEDDKKNIKDNKIFLKMLKEELINLFNGITIFKNVVGYWKNPKNEYFKDKLEIWQILINGNLTLKQISVLSECVRLIKKVTMQESQLYVINFDSYIINDNETFKTAILEGL